MNVTFGFAVGEKFYRFGDEIDVSFTDGTHFSGTLNGADMDFMEIIVDSYVFSLSDIVNIQ